MSELRGFYTLCLREFKRYLRDRIRIISSFFQPLLWLVIFGIGIGSALGGGYLVPGITYQELIFPGIVGQTLLMTAMFIGISVIWDREFGFMKEILVAPVSRMTVFLGKMVGDSISTLVQGIIVLCLGLAIGVNLTPVSFIATIPVMLLITFGLVSVGLVVASFMNSLESFGAVQSFVNLPMFFLSGALFPISTLPDWLKTIAQVNPLSYGVDALRHVTLGDMWTTQLQLQPLAVDLAVIAIFDIIMIAVGTWAFKRMK
jgi:ABC-2 type transport system permease protein